MITERNGKFYRQETTEKEISEIEYLREKIGILAQRISRLEGRSCCFPFSDPQPITIEPWRITCGTVTTGGNP